MVIDFNGLVDTHITPLYIDLDRQRASSMLNRDVESPPSRINLEHVRYSSQQVQDEQVQDELVQDEQVQDEQAQDELEIDCQSEGFVNDNTESML